MQMKFPVLLMSSRDQKNFANFIKPTRCRIHGPGRLRHVAGTGASGERTPVIPRVPQSVARSTLPRHKKPLKT